MDSYEECHSRCSTEPECLFTSYIIMTNSVQKRCYLFQEGAEIVLKEVVPKNNANVKEGKITILASKLTGNAGIEMLGIQVNRNTQPLKKKNLATHAQCFNACKSERYYID